MSYLITCSSKLLTLVIAPFLFILVSVLCEFAMVPGGYILLFPQAEELHSSSGGRGGEGGEVRCCHRPQQNKQICVPQNADFLKKVLKAGELILVGAVDL